VVICPEVAWRNAVPAQGAGDDEPAVGDHPVAEGANPAQRAYEDELALLVVHGLLHLEGMDHEDSTEAEAMEALERELLGRFYRAADAPASEAVPQPRS
jgi:probable rRNA maturation factor